MKKILITGSNGLLGQTLTNLLLKEPDTYEVIGLSRGENRSGRYDFEYHSIDITNQQSLSDCLLKTQPDFIVHTAAMTNVDSCEENRKECDLLNVTAVQYLVDLSKKIHAHLIHISTDFIFDGKQGYYKETDTPNPLSYYGLSKLKSEKVVNNSAIDYTILRTILVYGKVNNLGRNNIVLWIKQMLEEKREITIIDDQFRMPTYAEDLAYACKLSIDLRAQGTFNISSNTLLSIYDMAHQIAQTFELNPKYIKAVDTKTLNQKAQRPPKTGFDLTKTNRELGFFPKSFSQDLQRFKARLS